MNNNLVQMAVDDSAIELWGQNGSTWVNFISGGTNATLVNTPGFAPGSPGLAAGAGLDLDGISMHATISTALDALSGGSFTIIVAYIPRTSGATQEIIDSSSVGVGGTLLRQHPTADEIQFLFRNGATVSTIRSTAVVNINEVNVVGGRYDTTANKSDVYVNGVWRGAITANTDPANGIAGKIGRRADGSTAFLDAIVRTIVVIPSALSDTRVTQYREQMLVSSTRNRISLGHRRPNSLLGR